MKTHTSNFKEEIKLLGRQQDVRITYTINNEQIVLGSEDINSATPNYEASLLKSIMKVLELDSNVSIPKNTEIKFEYGLLVNGAYEYLDYGNYIVAKEPEKQEDTLSYKITCYDKMLYSMKDYEHIDITYPCTIKQYLVALCNKIGLQFKDSDFANASRQIINELFMTINEDGTYSSMGYTYRDVLDQIAETTGGCICITLDDKVEVRYINETNDTIDEEYINDTNVNFGEKYGPINSIVLARASESDKIYIKNQTSIDNNGLCELMISENQFMNFNDRSDYLQELADKLFGVEYYLNDFTSTGIMYYDLLDMYNVKIGDNIYNCLMLNDEQDITQGLEENIHTDRPETSETDYKKADTTDRKINQTYILVDKQNQKIESVISNVTDQNEKISQVTQTVEELNSKIGDIADITTSKESNTGTVSFEGINQSEPIRVEIHPIGTNISYLYPRDNLYPSDDLFMTDRILRFTNTKTNEVFDYELPDNLLYYDAENYDEFILDYDGLSCVINKKIGYNADGTTYILERPRTINYDFPKIELTDGDYTVELLGYSNAYLFVRLMAQNIYTTQFATKAEVNSEISQKADAINLSVDKKLSNYSTTQEMNSAISVKANEITSSVSKSYATKTQLTNEVSTLNSTITQKAESITSEVSKKVGNDEIISKINQSAEAVGIKANKIELSANDILNLLAGNTINLGSKNIVIASDNFNVDKNGKVTASNINITGGKINISGEGYASDLLRLTNSSNTRQFSYMQPIGAGFVNGDYRVDIFTTGEYLDGSTMCTIEASDAKGYTEISGEGIKTPKIMINNWNSIAHGSNALFFGTGSEYSGLTTSLRGNTVRIYSHSSGAVYLGYSGSTAVTSDENLKDISDIDNKYIEFFKKIKPITYIYKDRGHRTHIGFGARQVEDALTKAGLTTEQFAGILIDKDVTISADEAGTEEDMHYDELYSLRYEEFIALNTMMVQRQFEEIEKLMKRVEKLEVK